MSRVAPHLAELSDGFLTDAQGGRLSTRGRLDAMFGAGYTALMAFADAHDVRNEQHPSLKLAQRLCCALDLNVAVPRAYIENNYAGDNNPLPSFEAMEAWTFACRRR